MLRNVFRSRESAASPPPEFDYDQLRTHSATETTEQIEDESHSGGDSGGAPSKGAGAHMQSTELRHVSVALDKASSVRTDCTGADLVSPIGFRHAGYGKGTGEGLLLHARQQDTPQSEPGVSPDQPRLR